MTPAKPIFGKESDFVIQGEQFSAHARLNPSSVSLQENSISIQLVESRFTRTRDGLPLPREQFMTLLKNVIAFYFRAKLDNDWYEVKLIRIELDQAYSNQTIGEVTSGLTNNLKSARLVEKCSCPTGYSGNSCEVSYFNLI